jgi:putative oxidoreductase
LLFIEDSVEGWIAEDQWLQSRRFSAMMGRASNRERQENAKRRPRNGEQRMSIEARESRANLPGIVAAMFSNATVDRDYAPYGLFLLRISLGFDWLVHAFLKVSRGMYTHEALLAKNGITPLLAWPTFSLEVIGGVAILLGWYTRQWAGFLLIFLAVVVWIKWPVGWGYSNTGGGWEYPMLWLVAQAALVLAGSGAFALQGSKS